MPNMPTVTAAEEDSMSGSQSGSTERTATGYEGEYVRDGDTVNQEKK